MLPRRVLKAGSHERFSRSVFRIRCRRFSFGPQSLQKGLLTDPVHQICVGNLVQEERVTHRHRIDEPERDVPFQGEARGLLHSVGAF